MNMGQREDNLAYELGKIRDVLEKIESTNNLENVEEILEEICGILQDVNTSCENMNDTLERIANVLETKE